MTSPTGEGAASLSQLVIYLAARREALLNNWRTACEADPALKGVSSLSREEFNNRVPFLLNIFQQRLEGQPTEDQIGLLAAEHGLHRWQKGYTLAELSAEMLHLSNLLLDELRLFWQAYPSIDFGVMPVVYELFFAFANQINTASVGQYTDLQRIGAASRVEALEKALVELNELGQQRADLLRHSSHDLRSSFGAIQGAASLLELVIDSDQERNQMLDMLLRNLTNCRSLVTQLMDLARLEAGQESLNIQAVDAGQLLSEVVAAYQPLAAERGLLLQADGPASLPVECDPVQLQRIIQNLVLNALKHTPSGFVSVSWTRENSYRWIVSVQDSGPGLPTATQVGSLPQLLAPAPESTSAFGLPPPPPMRRKQLLPRPPVRPLLTRGKASVYRLSRACVSCYGLIWRLRVSPAKAPCFGCGWLFTGSSNALISVPGWFGYPPTESRGSTPCSHQNWRKLWVRLSQLLMVWGLTM